MRRSSGAVWLSGMFFTLLVIGLIWLIQGGAHSLSMQVVLWQRDLHRALTLAVTELSGMPSAATWMTLLGISFGYGVFHAAGPGHGKAVLTTYLLSQGGALRRALVLSCAASLLQALVAISLVAVLVHGLGWLTRQAMGSVMWVEQFSFAMVTLLGLWLCWRAVRQLRCAPMVSSIEPIATATQAPQEQFHLRPHVHHHAHCSCGSAHHVSPEHAADWRTALATVVAIGIRPCSGGVLLLGAASLLGQFWVGVVAVLVMAVGTALSVSGLALASVMARGWAQRRLERQSTNGRLQRILGWTALGGGVAIVLLGVSLLVAGASETNARPLLVESTASEAGAIGECAEVTGQRMLSVESVPGMLPV